MQKQTHNMKPKATDQSAYTQRVSGLSRVGWSGRIIQVYL